ncbi:chromate resistance protein ChrB domain-containing protein [Alicyclobacillus fastidiosus]|uniref:Chromate resistance protein n=1 Tax=Alicyclobacillus fastidiosus TaxID=392011 RepID=A0ABV5ALP9_9BACL|nr:chromate resistance protein ChrB domain-containing protein [Alicyclobacillus fastidiosus]WEH10601.1 chromate resistance protein [Alicyclobacillus fastidiosus]
MKWVTRENAHVERVACPWLILRFIDNEAEFEFVSRHSDPSTLDGIPFDMPGVLLGHREGRCSFESILCEYNLTDNEALVMMGKIIHGADIPIDDDLAEESAGIRAIAFGYMFKYGLRDHEKLAAQMELYDALYMYCQERVKKHRNLNRVF